MPTTVNKDIGGGAADYSSPSTWEADTDNDLVSADQIQVGRLYGEHTENVEIGGATTDSTRYRILQAASGQGLSGTDPGRYDGSQGAAITSTTTYTNATLYLTENYSRVAGLQVFTNAASNQPYRTDNANQADRCLFEGTSIFRGVVQNASAWPATYNACAIINRGASSGAGTVVSFVGMVLQNCTIATPSDLGDPADAIMISYPDGSAVIRNCVVVGYTNVGTIGTPGTCTNNYTDDASPPSGFTGITYNTTASSGNTGFENTSDGTHDFRIKSGSGLDANGTATGAPSTDIYGTAYDSPPAVGAWEVAAGGATTGSISITFSSTGTGASRSAAAGSAAITLGSTGTGAARAASAGSTSLVFGVTGTGVTRISSAASAGITFDVQGVGASRAGGAGSTSIVFSQTGVGAARQGAAGSTSITLDALGAGASSVVAAGSTSIVFDAQGVGSSVAAGTADGRADIVFDAQGVGASRVAGAGSVSLVFDAQGDGASRASAAGLQQIVFDAQGVGFESAPTIVSADGSASIVFGMFGDTTQAAAGSDGGKVSWRRRRQPVEYDEEADLMEIMAAALPMLRARGMLWDR